jgi:signal transduction histidine kinase/DNA-binding response OmpR family regulator
LLKFSASTEEIELFPAENELPITRFEQNSSLKGSDGTIYFGGQDGYLRFLPDKVVKSNYLPSVVITSLSVQNQTIEPKENYQGNVILDKSVTFSSSIVIDYEQRLFSLNFSTLEYVNRMGIRYAYQLEGIDPDWNFVSGQKGMATYSRIPAGNYVFRVKGTNSDGVWNNQETALRIKIRPPVWARPVFIFMYFVLIIGITGAIVYYYLYRLKWKNDLRIIRIEKEHAEELSKTKMQFFTNIFHEFHTPLSLIIGPLEKLAKNESLDTSGKNLVELIGKNARRIIRLNDQLLDYRQLESKKTHLKISEFEFIGFARNTFTLFTDKAARKRIDYRFEPETDVIEVKLDAEKIETILFNLLSNAFKFTNTQGIITLKTGLCKNELNNELTDCLYFTVSDTGIGISGSEQQRIFERYYQCDEARKMERGSGIGLTLVDEFVKMHLGTISIKSEPGKGSEFKVVLPLNQLVNEPDKSSYFQTDEQTMEPFGKAEANPALISTKPVILLIEDDRELSAFIAQCLRVKYNILTAFDGNEGLRKAEKQFPDLVITDIVLPGPDGITLTRKLKKNPRTAHIPVIILSAQADKQNQLEGLKNGADAFVAKPFEMEHLETRIANFIAHRKQLTNYLKTDKVTNPKIKETVSADEKMFQKIVAGIERNLSAPDLSIEKLVKETGFSQPIIYRKIKNITGLTTNELIRKVRLQHAEQLLKTKKFSVAEVMDQVGFSNHSYFSKCFRKLYKVSPKEYIDNA